MKIELNCANCGGNRFNYPVALTHNSMIVCADCDHEIGTVDELQQKVIDQLASHASPKASAKQSA
jgi:hypothetical protein